jgi:hypothetical protein
MLCAMLSDMQIQEIIDNISAFISEGDELTQAFFVEQLKDMNKDLNKWNELSIKEKMLLRSAFKEMITMNEVGKLIKNDT